MAKKDYIRILVENGGRLFSFVNLQCSPRDGSLHVTLRRDGTSDFRVGWSNRTGEETPTRVPFETPRKKNKKITIHQSGRINFPDRPDHPVFVEPLAYISKPFVFFGYRIPSISALSPFGKIPDQEDLVLSLGTPPDGAQSFEFVVAPKDYVADGTVARVEYLHRYAVSVVLHREPLPIRSGYENYFTTFSVGKGLFDKQAIDEHAALIAYHQAVHNTDRLIIYAPNADGVWQIVFSVPTRIAPRALIEPTSPDLYVEIEDQTVDSRVNRARVRFKVKNRKSGQIVRQLITFRPIVLDAEL